MDESPPIMNVGPRRLVTLAAVVVSAVAAATSESWAALAGGLREWASAGGVGAAYSPLNAEFLRSLGPPAVVAAVLLFFVFRLVRALCGGGGAPGARRAAQGAEAGASVIEFVLVFPVLLALLFMIMQIALLVQAKFVVNYAAFCAVRSAAVTIPAHIRSTRSGKLERPNRINLNDPRSPKMSVIRRAAAFPCIGISPLYSPRVGIATATTPDLSMIAPLTFAVAPFPPRRDTFDIVGSFLSRAQYAYGPDNTRVEVMRDGGGARFGEHDLVTVRVHYRYYLVMPFANRLFGEPYWGTWFFSRSGYFYSITEQYTLPVEGERPFPPGQGTRFRDEVQTETFE